MTNDEGLFYKHVALASWKGQFDPQIRVGAFLPLQWSEDADEIDAILAARNERHALSNEEINALNGILLRARYSEGLLGRGPLVFNCSAKLTRDEIEAYLNSLSEEQLRETVEESRLF